LKNCDLKNIKKKLSEKCLIEKFFGLSLALSGTRLGLPNFGLKNLWSKIFFVRKIVGKKVFGQKNCWSEKLLVRKIVGFERNKIVRRKFWSEKFIWQQNSLQGGKRQCVHTFLRPVVVNT
jgi:hypothetical protein